MSYLLDYNPGTQQWGYPRRGGAKLSGTVIVHTAECAADNVGEDTSAEGCANMIANRADYGSYHRLVDSDSIIDMLPWEYEAWQDSETNNWAVGISAALRTTDWLTMPADRRDRVYRNLAACAAEFVRYMAGKGVTVPLVRISGAQARARVPGFCAHGDSGIARSDPGAAFDWALFFAYTQAALDGSLQYAAESITTPEEDMPLNEKDVEWIVARVVEEIQPMHDVTREHIPGAVWKVPTDYRDPATGELSAQKTTPETVLSFADRHLVLTLDALTASARGIVDAVKAAPQADAAAAAEAAYKALEEKLANLKITLTAGDAK